MTGKEIYRIWAPNGAKWIDWVRPVPFVVINNDLKLYNISDFKSTNIDYIKESTNTAIIVDLPGVESIKEGISLCNFGFRPIPIYNGTIEQEGARATTDNKVITTGLIYGASKLEKISIKNDAPPAFLLDTNRTNRYKMSISIFDNSWDIYDQDLPTAEYFLNNGIDRIIVRSDKLQKDLKKILYKFQNKGITIYFTNGYEEPKKIIVRKVLEKDKE